MNMLLDMDEKIEDKSEESKKKHIVYYRSLSRLITNMKAEMNQEGEPAIKEHLTSRMDAVEKDRQRIRDLFPDIKKEEWDDDSN
mgnify:CR=1 FL=1|jgi:uncharacterized protein YicC (UPF0701 family)